MCEPWLCRGQDMMPTPEGKRDERLKVAHAPFARFYPVVRHMSRGPHPIALIGILAASALAFSTVINKRASASDPRIRTSPLGHQPVPIVSGPSKNS
jgi:hypothetical protein